MSPEEKANEIIDRLSARSGFDGWWGDIDGEIRGEILLEIEEIIKK